MEMFSKCFDKCDGCVIHYVGGCIAGHGDWDYVEITREKAIRLINERRVKDYLIPELKKKFNIE